MTNLFAELFPSSISFDVFSNRSINVSLINRLKTINTVVKIAILKVIVLIFSRKLVLAKNMTKNGKTNAKIPPRDAPRKKTTIEKRMDITASILYMFLILFLSKKVSKNPTTNDEQYVSTKGEITSSSVVFALRRSPNPIYLYNVANEKKEKTTQEKKRILAILSILYEFKRIVDIERNGRTQKEIK